MAFKVLGCTWACEARTRAEMGIRLAGNRVGIHGIWR